MGNLLVLTKVLLKNTLSFGSQSVKNKARFMKQVFLIIVFIAAFGPVLASFGYMVAGAYDLLAPVAQEGVLLGLSLSLVSVLVFFLSIFSVVSVFYFSQDIQQKIYHTGSGGID
jgi:ABC-2 type transport system permease protein